MPGTKPKTLLALILVGVLVGSGIALAQEEDGTDERDDTVFNFGYDQTNHFLIWNISADDYTYDCSLQTVEGEEDEVYTAAYSTGGDALAGLNLVDVDSLEDESGTVSFPPRPEDDVDTDEFDVAEDPAEYTGADGVCGLSGAEVEGPNGQINHGQFMKLFNTLYQGSHRGCLNRHLAHSDLGKGDTQLTTGEVNPEFEPGDTGTLTFTTELADCDKGKKNDEDTVESLSQLGQGKKPEKSSAGKSGSARGRNK